jgi:integrase
VLRLRHYSPRTEASYVGWVRRFVRFHGNRHPRDLGGPEVEASLSDLAVAGRVAASTQNQAFAAPLFLYRDLLGVPLTLPDHAVRAKQRAHVPSVLTRAEVWAVIDRVAEVVSRPGGTDLDRRTAALPVPALVATLLYGSGLRLQEPLRRRVQDVDLARGELVVRAGKGGKDRRTVLPSAAAVALSVHLARVRLLHRRDVAAGVGVPLPHALARKWPDAAGAWPWYWAFPARSR